jgi:hypothetical protein
LLGFGEGSIGSVAVVLTPRRSLGYDEQQQHHQRSDLITHSLSRGDLRLEKPATKSRWLRGYLS